VPTALVEYRRAAEVVDGIAAGQVDMTGTNATPVRAEKVSFTSHLLALELGFLVPTRSPVQNASDLDDPQHRVGVTQGGTSERTIQAILKHALIVPVPTLEAASEMLGDGSLDAYATSKSVLFEVSDTLPGSRVLAGRWGWNTLPSPTRKVARLQPRSWENSALTFVGAVFSESGRHSGTSGARIRGIAIPRVRSPHQSERISVCKTSLCKNGER
jgi:hypothetical protein